MKIAHNKIDGTFVIGISFSNHFNKKLGSKNTSLIFDLGSHSLAFIFRGEYQMNSFYSWVLIFSLAGFVYLLVNKFTDQEKNDLNNFNYRFYNSYGLVIPHRFFSAC